MLTVRKRYLVGGIEYDELALACRALLIQELRDGAGLEETAASNVIEWIDKNFERIVAARQLDTESLVDERWWR